MDKPLDATAAQDMIEVYGKIVNTIIRLTKNTLK